MEPGANRTHGTPCDLTDFLIAEAFDIGKQHDLPLLAGEACERLGDRFTEVSVDIFLDWLDCEGASASEQLRLIIFRDLFWITSFTTPKFVPVKICDDPVDPRKEGGPWFEALPRAKDANEGLLGEIAGIGFVASQAVSEVIRRLTIMLDGMLKNARWSITVALRFLAPLGSPP